ncbi:MAG: diguanylate cyclase [Candidatus Brocadiaceae bacterium]|jgi:diguanylate cyclase (GGDEF)-like protein
MKTDSIAVLLIDDNPGDAQLIQQMLGGPAADGFAVEYAGGLDDGLDRLSRNNVDVILLGISVPGALAVGDVDTVHRHAEGVPIIVLTSMDETEMFLDTARGGAADYLVKTRMSTRELSRAIRYAVERTRMERARRQAEASLRHLVHSSADAMVVIDDEDLVQFVNPAAEQLFARAPEELIGEPFGFPVEPGEQKEVRIKVPDAGTRIAEIRAVETIWEGQKAKLASLRDVTDVVEMREELRAMSLRDQLTGLYNRRGFTTLAEQQLKLADRTGMGLLLFFADLDGFKAVNDEYGHPEGDEALKDVAHIFCTTFRESDIVARVGGDEFCVLAVGARRNGIEAAGHRLQEALNARLARSDRPYDLSLTLGAAYREPDEGETLEDLMARADQAMYARKNAE